MKPFHELTWWKIPVRLRNVRNTFAKQHPLFIFKAFLKSACSRANPAIKTPFLFHPVGQALPRRINKNQLYELEVVLPAADRGTVDRFAKAIVEQADRQPRNFEVDAIGAAQERRLALLEEEARAALDLAADEVCLDFLTPVDFRPRDGARQWMIDAKDLAQLGVVHLARLFPGLPWPVDLSIGRVDVLPYYWDRAARILHESKSGSGHEAIEGFVGPLFLRGEWQSLLPLLLLNAELHTGLGRADENGLKAQRHLPLSLSTPKGAYRLCQGRSFFDRMIKDPALYVRAAEELSADGDDLDDLSRDVRGLNGAILGVAESVREGRYEPRPARLFEIPKKSDESGGRDIGLLHGADRVAHRAFASVLAPVFNRMFEYASIGYRPGMSIETARKRIHSAVMSGASCAVRADVESFFDSMDWTILGASIDRVLPRADALTRAILDRCMRMPAEKFGTRVGRSCGVLQGSALSPLLANLYLDRFDEQMQAKGHRLTRYGDDFVILADSREQAEVALSDANAVLEPLKLRLHPDKTAIVPLDLGFSFLGMDLPAALEGETVERSALRKSLFIKEAYSFVGVDGSSVVVRKKDDLLGRFPMYRLAEIVFLGPASVSTALLQRCATERIPVSFCSPAGWYSSTLRPDSRAWFGLVAKHSNRHRDAGDAGRLAIARHVVEAKIRNYRHWMRALPGDATRSASEGLERLLRSLSSATSVDALRGYEGSAARLTFAFVNGILHPEEFRSERRLPREKPDRYNTLIDALYSLLFARINVLVRGAGLNPYLGFLHSPDDNYESLVCDLQEPFRARMDRLAVKLVNRKEIAADGFEQRSDGRWRLTGGTYATVIEAFEREEQVRLAGEGSTLGQLISGQVYAVREWVEGRAESPAIFVAEAMGKARAQERLAKKPGREESQDVQEP